MTEMRYVCSELVISSEHRSYVLMELALLLVRVLAVIRIIDVSCLDDMDSTLFELRLCLSDIDEKIRNFQQYWVEGYRCDLLCAIVRAEKLLRDFYAQHDISELTAMVLHS